MVGMIAGFIIWSVVSAIFIGIGLWTWKSDKAAGFFSGVKPPEVKDIRKYNHSVAVLWFVYAILLELLGRPLLFLKQNSAGFLWSILGVAGISIGLVIGYNRILCKHRQSDKA